LTLRSTVQVSLYTAAKQPLTEKVKEMLTKDRKQNGEWRWRVPRFCCLLDCDSCLLYTQVTPSRVRWCVFYLTSFVTSQQLTATWLLCVWE